MGSLALSFQNVPPAPGRESTGTAAPAQAASPAAPQQEPGLGPLLPMLLMIVPLLLIMMWGSRSQQKKQAALLTSLTKGDRVITQSGLVGKFVEMNERIAKIEISPGVKVEVLRSGILGKDTPESAAAVDKAVAEKK
ncbi:MAG TPA: preprotein translocase subunit YajC [Polyangiaceae bacterium]|nr:preprotein translocase subunit YajC [Polyangiaceae bacterium]